MGSAFKAATDTAYNLSWTVGLEYSPDKELDDSSTLKTLRRRSKQLIKDNDIAAGIQQAFINVIGAPNIVKVISDNRIQSKQLNDILEEFVENADITGKSLPQVIEEIVSSSFVDGDILISLPIDNKRTGIKTVIEVIEAHRIQTPNELKSDNKLSHGVQYDAEGRVEGYWVKKADKVDSYSNAKEYFDFYPKYKEYNGYRRQVTKLFKAPLNSRPKMSRQYPLITPVMGMIKQLDDYIEAVIVGARVAACFAGFIKTNNPAQAFKSFTTDAEGNILDPQDANESRKVHKLFPGMISYLKPGQDISFASPNRPNDNVDLFIVRMMKRIASYFRIPYTILFMDLVEVNYSSWRGGANEMKKMVGRWRRDLNGIVDWVVKTVFLEASVGGFARGDTTKVNISKRWPVQGILDPEKEARANKIRLLNGDTSPQQICDENGEDYDTIMKEMLEHKLALKEQEALVLKRQMELEEKYGIEFNPMEESDGENSDGNGGGKKDDTGDGDNEGTEEEKEKRKEGGNW